MGSDLSELVFIDIFHNSLINAQLWGIRHVYKVYRESQKKKNFTYKCIFCWGQIYIYLKAYYVIHLTDSFLEYEQHILVILENKHVRCNIIHLIDWLVIVNKCNVQQRYTH